MADLFEIPLNFDDEKSLEHFLYSLENDKLYENIKNARETLPEGASELIDLVKDEWFLSKSKEVHEKCLLFLDKKASILEIKHDGQEIDQYLSEKYPSGYNRLSQYAYNMAPELVNVNLGDAFSVAVNTEAAVNVAVVVNVAAATHAVVAAIVVAVATVIS